MPPYIPTPRRRAARPSDAKKPPPLQHAALHPQLRRPGTPPCITSLRRPSPRREEAAPLQHRHTSSARPCIPNAVAWGRLPVSQCRAALPPTQGSRHTRTPMLEARMSPPFNFCPASSTAPPPALRCFLPYTARRRVLVEIHILGLSFKQALHIQPIYNKEYGG